MQKACFLGSSQIPSLLLQTHSNYYINPIKSQTQPTHDLHCRRGGDMRAPTPTAASPTSGELAAAAALLLLPNSSPAPPTTSPPPAPILSDELSSYSTSSSSCSDASARSCVSDLTLRGRPADPLRVLAVVASLRRIDPKVLSKATRALFQGEEAKKRKGVWIEIDDEEEESERGSAVASEESTMTASASGGSTATSGRSRRSRLASGGNGGRLWRRAKAILDWLSQPHAAPTTEMAIRDAVGDNADTSRALRWLMKQRDGCISVWRAGAGGRMDPYVYMVAGRRSEVYLH